jgi:REP-associated tyrosine transposase
MGARSTSCAMNLRSFPLTQSPHKGWYKRGYLPHYDTGDIYQMITYRLADSLPQARLKQIDAELKLIPPELLEDKRRIMIEKWLDAGHGSCILRELEHANIVEATWKHFDAERYDLISWVVMTNHVHVLIKVKQNSQLEKIVKSWKSYTAREINKLSVCAAGATRSQNTTGRFWQTGYWDRYARNENHLIKMLEYIKENYDSGGVLFGNNYESSHGSA